MKITYILYEQIYLMKYVCNDIKNIFKHTSMHSTTNTTTSKRDVLEVKIIKRCQISVTSSNMSPQRLPQLLITILQ